MAKKIAFMNQKGGVGKTTSALCLADVLFWVDRVSHETPQLPRGTGCPWAGSRFDDGCKPQACDQLGSFFGSFYACAFFEADHARSACFCRVFAADEYPGD